mgnify:CR=1 FL=1
MGLTQVEKEGIETLINNNADNRVITGSGTANTLNGEAGLTFDGSTMNFTAASGDARLTLIGTEGNDARITLSADDGDDHIDQWNLRAEAANHFAIDQFAGGSFVERLTIASDASNGDVTVKTGDLIFGTAGKGICLGVTSNTADNTLDDYEEGDYTPTDNSGASLSFTTNNTGKYTKIGRLVTCHFDITFPTTSSSSVAKVSLPFSGGLNYGGGVSNFNGGTHPAFIHVSGSDAYIMDVDSSRGHSSAHMLNSECSAKRWACNFWYYV